MVWFKVDDKLHSHWKAMQAGSEAMGLWSLAGSWAADQLTDGWVPTYAAERITPHFEEYAARLVAAELWVPGEHRGSKGWWFHEWAENGQPLREDVKKRQADQRERVRRWRERHGYGKAGNAGGDDARNALPDASPAGNALPNALVTVPPTRPDPTRPVGEGQVSSSGAETLSDAKSSGETNRASRIPGDFAVTNTMRAWARTEIPDVDIEFETKQFIDYWQAKAGRDATKRDWFATWRTWMRKAGQQTGRGRKSSGNNDDGWDALK